MAGYDWRSNDSTYSVGSGSSGGGSGGAGMPAFGGAVSGIAAAGSAIIADYNRKTRNRAREAHKREVIEEARDSRISQLDDARRAMERTEVKARVATAQVNQGALMRRGQAMARAGFTGSGGVTADQLIQSEEYRQSRELSGIEVQLRMQRTDRAEQDRAIFHQERQRLLQASAIRPEQSTLGASLIGAGNTAASTYINLKGSQDRGVQQAIQATA